MKGSAIIIQARISSARFPGKMMLSLAGIPLVEYVYRRCCQCSVENVIVATSLDSSDDPLHAHCQANNIPVIRGTLDNVLDRYIKAANYLKAKYIGRVCADTPFFDLSLLEASLKVIAEADFDYVASDRNSCASGFYSETVKLKALESSARITSNKDDLEHVTRFILNNEKVFSGKAIKVNFNPQFIKDIRLTVDYPKDLELANNIITHLPDKLNFSSNDILEVVKEKIVPLWV
jgi:spore coat polysaccharide biosynthesis protein SpsF